MKPPMIILSFFLSIRIDTSDGTNIHHVFQSEHIRIYGAENWRLRV